MMQLQPDSLATTVTAPPRPPQPAVLLVDDHDLFRAGLRTLLESQGMRVVGDTRCERGAVDMARRTNPTVMLVDAATVDGMSTDRLMLDLREAAPDAGVLVFARSTSEGDVYRSIRAGALGYVAKDAPVDDLAAAVRAVHGGSGWLNPDVTAMVLGFIRTGQLPMTADTELSDREVEVLRHVARGFDNNQIAAELGISAKTVKNHVSSIFVKLELVNRVQAAVFAVRTGIA